MLFIRLCRFIAGYIIFTASGGFPERFVNLCAGMEIDAWDMRMKNGKLYGKTDIAGYKKMRHAAKRSGMTLEAMRRVGLPFFNRKHRRRVGLLAGFIVFILFSSFMSRLVWTVKIEGNVNIPDEIIAENFARLGVRPGVKASSIDASVAEISALQEMPYLMWTAVNLNGSSVIIEVRERPQNAVKEKETFPSHITALSDGVIRVLEAYEGEKRFKEGSAVSKGDIIISGITENKDGSVTFHHARGYVAAETRESIDITVKKEADVKRLLKSSFKITLNIFGFDFPKRKPAPDSENIKNYAGKKYTDINGIRLPVGYTVHRSLYYEDEKKSYIKDELRLKAVHMYLKAAFEKTGCADVLSRKITAENSGGYYTLNGSYTLLKNIGKTERIMLEQEGSS